MTVILVLLASGFAAVVGLVLLRLYDQRVDRVTWQWLARRQAETPQPFDPGMIADLPEPARRYLGYAILPGAPLWTVAEIDMTGTFALGDQATPKEQPMTARQILALPYGFIWAMQAGPIGGSDGFGAKGSWTRFRLFGVLPVARSDGSEDHLRSAFARLVAEAVFWTPAAVLPGPGIHWESAGPDTARLTVTQGKLCQSVDLTLAADGRPLSMVMPRWSNANPEKRWQIQPFGAVFGDHRPVGGFRLPFDVQAGNFFGTADWFAFFRARVSAIRFAK